MMGRKKISYIYIYDAYSDDSIHVMNLNTFLSSSFYREMVAEKIVKKVTENPSEFTVFDNFSTSYI